MSTTKGKGKDKTVSKTRSKSAAPEAEVQEPKGHLQLWFYTWKTLADLFRMSERDVRKLMMKGEFDPRNLRSVLRKAQDVEVARARRFMDEEDRLAAGRPSKKKVAG